MDAYEKAVQKVLQNNTHEQLAQIIVNALATAWAVPEWDSEMVEWVLENLGKTNHAEHGEDEWQKIAVKGNLYDADDFRDGGRFA